MFNWVRRLFRVHSRNKNLDFDQFHRIISQIVREQVKDARPEYHDEFVRLCDEEGFEALPINGDQFEAKLRREFYKYFGTLVFGGSRSGRAMEIEIGFIKNPMFNAWATTRGKVDLIGVNSGLWIVLIAAIRALLSHPYLFPYVGDPGRYRRRVFPPEFTSLPLDSTIWDTTPLECPVREQLAGNIWSVALCYMIEHEFAHVWKGHTDYLAEAFGLARLDEIRSGQGYLGIQAMEIDADRSAATKTLAFALGPTTTYELVAGKIKWNLPSLVQSSSTLNLTEYCTFAACLLGLLKSDVHELEDPDFVRSTHPPAIVRMIANLHEIVSTLSMFAGHDGKATLGALNPVIDGMINSHKALLPGARWDISEDRVVDQATQLITVYDRQLLALRPKLNLFKRGNISETENPFYG